MMFSRLFHRDKDKQTPVDPTEQDDTNTEATPSGLKRKFNENDSPAPEQTKKHQRFELENNDDKTWDLPSGLASYVNKYMGVHISEKDIKDKILSLNPVPSNIKEPQVLDNYIKRTFNG